jgi:hypothetical protein
MPFSVIAPQLAGWQGIDVVGDVQAHPLGTIVTALDPIYGVGEFIYLKGVASTIRGSVVIYNYDDHSTTLLVPNAIGPVGVAMAANVAGKFGWYQISGKAVVDSNTVADNGNVYATATPGEVDDAVVAGDRIKGAVFASVNGTPSAGLAECEIARPFMDDAVAA